MHLPTERTRVYGAMKVLYFRFAGETPWLIEKKKKKKKRSKSKQEGEEDSGEEKQILGTGKP